MSLNVREEFISDLKERIEHYRREMKYYKSEEYINRCNLLDIEIDEINKIIYHLEKIGQDPKRQCV